MHLWVDGAHEEPVHAGGLNELPLRPLWLPPKGTHTHAKHLEARHQAGGAVWQGGGTRKAVRCVSVCVCVRVCVHVSNRGVSLLTRQACF